jgi:hypothetical protein
MPQPGPQFQALPDPAPLPPLPQPSRPEGSMAPETAPAGLPQPGATSLEAKHKSTFNGIFRHLLQDGGPPELPAPLLPEPFAAEAPMTAPGVCSIFLESEPGKESCTHSDQHSAVLP